MDLILMAVAGIIESAFKIWANHTGKPEGWKPTAEDVTALLGLVNEATPEKVKADAAKRLGMPWPPVVVTPPIPGTPP